MIRNILISIVDVQKYIKHMLKLHIMFVFIIHDIIVVYSSKKNSCC